MGGRSAMEVGDWGIIKAKGFLDIRKYVEPEPIETGYTEWIGNTPVVKQHEDYNGLIVINGDYTSRYCYPGHKKLHYECKKRLEHILNDRLTSTYWFDRWYMNGSSMAPHKDRPACEISVSMNISQDTHHGWPLMFDIDGEETPCFTQPGDAVIYKGMDFQHWRNKFHGNSFHQIFFHFVRTDGHYLEYANPPTS